MIDWLSNPQCFSSSPPIIQDPRLNDVPIKVERVRGESPFEPEGITPDERLMYGHNHSSDSPNSRNSSDNSKVHHIPIFIEGRDEPVSQIYRHETVQEDDEPRSLSRTSSQSSNGRRSNISSATSPLPYVSSSPNRDPEHPIVRRGARKIPITVESPIPSRQVRPGATYSSQSQTKTNPTKVASASGPFVTKVPVGKLSPRDEEKEARGSTPEPAKVVKKPVPLEEIQDINNELTNLKSKVETFSGDHQDKEYRYLEEMLTRLLIRLDNVEPNGDIAIRTARKATVNAVEACASLLEAKGGKHMTTEPVTISNVEMRDETADTSTDPEIEIEIAETQAPVVEPVDSNPESNDVEVAMSVDKSVQENVANDSPVSASEVKSAYTDQPAGEITTVMVGAAEGELCDESMSESSEKTCEPQTEPSVVDN